MPAYTVITEYYAAREVEVEASTPEKALEEGRKLLPSARMVDVEPFSTTVFLDEEIVLGVDE